VAKGKLKDAVDQVLDKVKELLSPPTPLVPVPVPRPRRR
jgi:hypothetical protein